MTNFLQTLFTNTTTRRGIGAIVIFLIIWHIGSQLDEWTGYDLLGIGRSLASRNQSTHRVEIRCAK